MSISWNDYVKVVSHAALLSQICCYIPWKKLVFNLLKVIISLWYVCYGLMFLMLVDNQWMSICWDLLLYTVKKNGVQFVKSNSLITQTRLCYIDMYTWQWDRVLQWMHPNRQDLCIPTSDIVSNGGT